MLDTVYRPYLDVKTSRLVVCRPSSLTSREIAITWEGPGMSTTETAQRFLSITEKAREGEGSRTFVGVRRALDIGSFGANAIYQAKAGEELVNEHDERGPGSPGQ